MKILKTLDVFCTKISKSLHPGRFIMELNQIIDYSPIGGFSSLYSLHKIKFFL